MKDYERLYKKYVHRKDRLSFTKEDVERIIIKKFKATAFPKEALLDLKNDDHFDYDKIYKCFVIDDPQILHGLYSDEERKLHREDLLDHRENPLNPRKVKDWDYNHIIMDELEGRRIDIVLESKDGEVITEFEVRNCESMNRYLNALIVCSNLERELTTYSEDIHDENFQFYLDNLDEYGFLD
ncbi:hypothetical protein MM221_10300 [Salipaludibacillus sp. LMS25]|jgi:hypothetical protein|uniref:hypothetical protein n=1 Tax=Salipaludibacillus sp. LMS25 TaxID=2924031 RepID=UPI0020D11465|nr:hypothetical protein [Salipaludibacillus sp. LMS25]UTR16862.1 hypothetical protein MM221_10300 [Salipaludibacillus sp. LMS25]